MGIRRGRVRSVLLPAVGVLICLGLASSELPGLLAAATGGAPGSPTFASAASVTQWPAASASASTSGDTVDAADAALAAANEAAAQDLLTSRGGSGSAGDGVAGLAPGDEVVAFRTETSKTFATSTPGTYRTLQSTNPVHMRDEGGAWVDIDPTFVEATDGTYETRRSPVPVSVDPAGAAAATVALGDDLSIGFSLSQAGAATVEPVAAADADALADGGTAAADAASFGAAVTVEDSTADGAPAREVTATPEDPFMVQEPDAFAAVAIEKGSVDSRVVLRPTGSGLKELIVLDGPGAPLRYVFDLDLQGLTAVLRDAGKFVEFLSADGAVAAVVPGGFMVDSAGGATKGPGWSDGVRYELVQSDDGKLQLAVELDSAWLADPARVFPVVADPTVIAFGVAEDTMVISTDSTGASSAYLNTYPFFGAGYNTGTARVERALLRFSNYGMVVPPAPNKVQVLSALVDLDGHPSYCSGTLYAYQPASNWTAGVVHWGTQPAATLVSGQSFLGANSCTSSFQEIQGLGPLVNSWVNNPATNYGLELRSGSESSSGGQYYLINSREGTGTGPMMDFYWASVPTVSNLSPAAGAGVGTPVTASATYAAYDGAAGFVRFRLYNSSGSQLLGTYDSPTVSNGATAYVTFPSNVATYPNTYSWTAQAIRPDAQAPSPGVLGDVSALRTFTVSTTAGPPTVTVTANPSVIDDFDVPVTITAQITSGTSAATTSTLSFPVPSGWSAVPGSVMINGSACASGCTTGSTVVVPVNLAAFASSTVTFQLVASAALLACSPAVSNWSVTTPGTSVVTGQVSVSACPPGLGREAWWSFTDRSLGLGSSAGVNVANGNLVVSATDSTPVQGDGRLGYVLRRTYNSQAPATVDPYGLGQGWSLNVTSAGDTAGVLTGTALTIPSSPGDALAQLSPTLVDRDGTRHRFSPGTTSVTSSLTDLDPVLADLVGFDAPGLIGSLGNLLVSAASDPTGLLAAPFRVCVDTTYVPPAGVHLSMWRFIAIAADGANGACPSAPEATGVVLGYATMRPDRVRQVFNALGQLQSMVDPAGNELRYSYSAGALAYVYEPALCANPVDPTCRRFAFVYDTVENKVTVTDPAGRTIVYQRTGNQLTSVTTTAAVGGATLEQWTYTYSTTSVPCGDVGLLCTVQSTGGTPAAPTKFTYTTPSGGRPRVASIAERYLAGDANGPTQAQLTTAFTYTGSPTSTSTDVIRGARGVRYAGIDSAGRVTSMREAASTQLTSGPLLRHTTFLWDTPGCRIDGLPDNNLCVRTADTLTISDPNAPSGWALAPAASTSWTYTPEGLPLAETVTNNVGGNLTTTLGYVTTYTRPDGSRVTVDDNPTGVGAFDRQTTADAPTPAVRPAPGEALYVVADRVATYTPRGVRSTWTVDNNPVGDTTPPAGGPTTPVGTVGTGAACGSGDSGLVCRQVADATGIAATATYTYDDRGRRLTMTTPKANEDASSAHLEYRYYDDSALDASGSVSAAGWLRSVTDQDGHYVVFAYDRAGNTVRTWDRDATVTGPADPDLFDTATAGGFTETRQSPTVISFAGAAANPWRYPIVRIDQLGNTTRSFVDDQGNTTRIRPPRGVQADGLTATTSTYDTVLTFNARDLLVSTQLPESTTAQLTTNRYDEAGNTVAATDPNGNVTTTVYDAVNRATTHRFTRSAGPLPSTLSANGCVLATAAHAPIPLGRVMCSTTTTYDGLDHPVRVADADGAPTYTRFDQAGRPVETWVARATGEWLRSRSVLDADGNTLVACPPRQANEGPTEACAADAKYSTTSVYDSLGRVTETRRYRQQTDAAGTRSATVFDQMRTTFGYDDDGNQIRVTEPRGTAAGTSAFDVTTTYDYQGRAQAVSSHRDATTTFTTTTTYTPSGDVTSVTAGAGTPDEAITLHTYDPAHRSVDTIIGASSLDPALIDEPTSAAQLVAQDQRTRNLYDPDGNLVGSYSPRAFEASVADPDERWLTRTDFDRNGRPIANWQPLYDTSSSAFAPFPGGTGEDTGDCPVQSADHHPNPVAGVTDYQAATGPNTIGICVTRASYDPAGRLRTQRNAAAGRITTAGAGGDNADDSLSTPTIYRHPNRWTEYRYTDDNLVAEVIAANPNPVAQSTSRAETGLPAGRVRVNVNSYDAAARPVQSIDPADYRTTTGYTADGLVKLVESGKLNSSIDAQATGTYDHGGNLTGTATMVTKTVTDTTTNLYNSDGTTYTTAVAALTTRYRYDLAGNPTDVWSPSAVAGDATNPSHLPTRLSYTNDNLLAASDEPTRADGTEWRRTTQGFDALARPTATTTFEVNGTGNPLAGNVAQDTQQSVFNDNGTLRSELGRTNTAGTSEQIDHYYNPDTSPATTVAVATQPVAGTTTTVDTHWLNGAYRTGNTTSTIPGAVARYYRQRWTGDNQQAQLDIAVDPAFTTTEDSRSFTYDDAGALDALVNTGLGTPTTPWTIVQDHAGRPTTMTDIHGRGTTYTYNDDSTLDQQTLYKTATSTVLARYTYQYDGRNRITSQARSGRKATGASASGTFTYQYDTAGRVSSFGAPSGTTTYTYDANNNRLTGGRTATYNPDNSIKIAAGLTFDYDQFGRNTTDGCANPTYDGFDRTTGTTSTGPCAAQPATTYTYDGLDRQITRQDGTQPAVGLSYLGSTTTPYLELPAGGTASSNRYITTPSGQPLATVGNSNTLQVLHSNGDGSLGTVTTAATSTTSNPECTVRYDPWGNPQGAPAAPGGPEVPAPNMCDSGSTFASTFYNYGRRDTTTGDYQAGNRTYNPKNATWRQADNTRGPGAANAGSIHTDPLTSNRYSYVNGDPINLTDASGHRPCLDDACEVFVNPRTHAINSHTFVTAYHNRQANQTGGMGRYLQSRGSLPADWSDALYVERVRYFDHFLEAERDYYEQTGGCADRGLWTLGGLGKAFCQHPEGTAQLTRGLSYVAGAATLVAGGAAVYGLPSLIAQDASAVAARALIGGAVGAVTDAGLQQALTGDIDLAQVAVSGILGALTAPGLSRGGAAAEPSVAGEAAATTAPTVGSGNAYSVAFEARLSESSFPGLSRGAHFQGANANLVAAMDADPAFAQAMDDLIPGVRDQLIGPRSISRGPPTDWTWHHAPEPGAMQLVPRIQHTAPGALQQLFHPGGLGGYAIWGVL